MICEIRSFRIFCKEIFPILQKLLYLGEIFVEGQEKRLNRQKTLLLDDELRIIVMETIFLMKNYKNMLIMSWMLSIRIERVEVMKMRVLKELFLDLLLQFPMFLPLRVQ